MKKHDSHHSQVVRTPALHVTRDMEDHITWADGSKIKRHVQVRAWRDVEMEATDGLPPFRKEYSQESQSRLFQFIFRSRNAGIARPRAKNTADSNHTTDLQTLSSWQERNRAGLTDLPRKPRIFHRFAQRHLPRPLSHRRLRTRTPTTSTCS